MCKSNLSLALILLAASMACAISANAHAQRGELTTADSASKPLSTGDASSAQSKTLQAEPRDKIRDSRRLVRNSTGSSLGMKSLDDSPEVRVDRKLARRSSGISVQTKSDVEQTELTTADGSLANSKPIHPGDTAIVMIEGEIQAEGELSTADGLVKPMVKPAPGGVLEPNWTRIAPGDMHVMTIPIHGWTIFSLQADNHDALLNVFIYDKQGNVLAEFDNSGCGAFLQVEPQVVIVVIENTSLEYANKYVLHVFDVM